MKSLKAIPIIVALASLGGALYCYYKIISKHSQIQYDFMNTHGYPDADNDDEFGNKINTAEDYMFEDSG